MPMRHTALILFASLSLTLAAACDGGGDSAPTPEDTPDATAPRSAATPTSPAPSPTSVAPADTPPAATATPPPVSSRPPPATAIPTRTPDIGPDGVPRVPPLSALTFSVGDRLLPQDLYARGSNAAGRGQPNVARVLIPSIGVDAAVEPHIVGANGSMPDPTAADVVAWYDFSAFAGIGGLPLSGGNAVFAGDLDRVRVGPGVFWRLAEVQPGGIITLALRDGRQLYYFVEFNKLASRDVDFADITAATADESATFITAAGTASADGYSERRILWARRVNCSPGGVSCELPR